MTIKELLPDLGAILKYKITDGDDQEVYLFTGIGVRNRGFHLGHHVLFKIISHWSARGLPVVYQISNDEKRFLAGKPRADVQMRQLTHEVLDTLERYPWGERFRLLDNLRDRELLRPFAEKINSTLTIRKMATLFGPDFDCYRANYVGYQLAPVAMMSLIHPHLKPVVVIAEDQLPFFLALRDVAYRLHVPKPQILVVTPLQDMMMSSKKMSASDGKTMIPLWDLSRIKKAISGVDATQDFCDHLLTYLVPREPTLAPLVGLRRSAEKKQKIYDYLKTDLATQRVPLGLGLSEEWVAWLHEHGVDKFQSWYEYLPPAT